VYRVVRSTSVPIGTDVLSGKLIVDDGVLVDQPGLRRYLPAEPADK
jgi:hypothetical protein